MKNSPFLNRILLVLFTQFNNPNNKLIRYIYRIIQVINFGKIKKFKTQIGIRLDDFYRRNLNSINIVERDFIFYIKNYLNNPKIILELGSRDGIQSLEFFNIFPSAKIYAFECYPPNIKRCIRNTKYIKNIEIVPKAVFNKDGIIKFYSNLGRNSGAGSLYRINKKYDAKEEINQKEIIVDATRIDTWANKKKINKIDLCWLDLQGAEYEALESMGEMISDVDAFFIEVELQEIYKGIRLYDDIQKFLEENGFLMIKFQEAIKNIYGNAIFLNINLIE